MRDKALDASSGEAMEITAAVNSFPATVAHKKRFCCIGTLVEILLKPVGCHCANENGPVFLAFPPYHELAAFEVNVIAVESYKFRHAQA